MAEAWSFTSSNNTPTLRSSAFTITANGTGLGAAAQTIYVFLFYPAYQLVVQVGATSGTPTSGNLTLSFANTYAPLSGTAYLGIFNYTSGGVFWSTAGAATLTIPASSVLGQVSSAGLSVVLATAITSVFATMTAAVSAGYLYAAAYVPSTSAYPYIGQNGSTPEDIYLIASGMSGGVTFTLTTQPLGTTAYQTTTSLPLTSPPAAAVTTVFSLYGNSAITPVYAQGGTATPVNAVHLAVRYPSANHFGLRVTAVDDAAHTAGSYWTEAVPSAAPTQTAVTAQVALQASIAPATVVVNVKDAGRSTDQALLTMRTIAADAAVSADSLPLINKLPTVRRRLHGSSPRFWQGYNPGTDGSRG